MERLEGHDLAARIDDLNRRDQMMPLDDAIRIARSVAEALRYAHQHDIAHRDIKPGNIFLSDDGRVVVMDFGIAKLLSSEDALTTTGTVIGTPHYFAPEQGSGQPVDYRVDIYALGVVFYEMLTGQVPTMPTDARGLAQHANAPILIRAVGRSAAGSNGSSSAMAKDPQHRYPDMAALMPT
jgi:serine/threonine-protein kinase PpkA